MLFSNQITVIKLQKSQMDFEDLNQQLLDDLVPNDVVDAIYVVLAKNKYKYKFNETGEVYQLLGWSKNRIAFEKKLWQSGGVFTQRAKDKLWNLYNHKSKRTFDTNLFLLLGPNSKRKVSKVPKSVDKILAEQKEYFLQKCAELQEVKDHTQSCQDEALWDMIVVSENLRQQAKIQYKKDLIRFIKSGIQIEK